MAIGGTNLTRTLFTPCGSSWLDDNARMQSLSRSPSEYQEGNHHADDDEGQRDAQHPADDAGRLALPRVCRSISRWWLIGHARPLNARPAPRFCAEVSSIASVVAMPALRNRHAKVSRCPELPIR
jgi:hypothetical protein